VEVPQGYHLLAILNNHKWYFSFTKSEHRRLEQVLLEGVDTSRKGKVVGKRCRSVNMVQILCTHVYKWINNICLNYSRNGGRGNKGE
jgi:hypothetical protein